MYSYIDALQGAQRQAAEAALQIWAHPETGFEEHFASGLLVDLLRQNGFTVTYPYGDVATAFRAVWGEGKPVIGLLAEYDALPGLSQAVATKPQPIVEGAPGHGCGHNLNAGATLAAALETKEQLEREKRPGTLVVYGCPAEEVLTGKVFMARAGAFRELDAALIGYGGTANFIQSGIRYAAIDSMVFHFKGVSAHAAVAAWHGRSALDAVELMDTGANYLREHVTQDVRIHYVITDGGKAPNIVPEKASVWYYVRAASREQVEAVSARLRKIAEGAAKMTGTSVSVEYRGGCYDTVLSSVLGELFEQSVKEVPPLEWTPEELAFADELNRQAASSVLSGAGSVTIPKDPIKSDWMPRVEFQASGSIDVGDVSRLVPTCVISCACANALAPQHSWQTVACSGHSLGIHSMLYRARLLQNAAMHLYSEPQWLERAKSEFENRKFPPYVCPIPASVKPLPSNVHEEENA